MAKIPVASLYEYCKKMLSEKWGYILGTAGVMWTEEKQRKVKEEMASQYGSRWIGHMVTDCSGVMVYIWGKNGKKIDHGSNSIARKFVGQMTKVPMPGYAAFIHKDEDTAKYPDGKGDYSHIGIVAEDGKHVYESQGTKVGFTTTSVSRWHWFAPFKDVNYDVSSDTQQPKGATMENQYTARVNAQKVRVRSGPGKTYSIIRELSDPATVTVMTEADGWSYVMTDSGSGYISSQYLTCVAATPGDAGDDKEVEFAEMDPGESKWCVCIPCSSFKQAQELNDHFNVSFLRQIEFND